MKTGRVVLFTCKENQQVLCFFNFLKIVSIFRLAYFGDAGLSQHVKTIRPSSKSVISLPLHGASVGAE